MTHAVLDDHLLRDMLADDLSDELRQVMDNHDLATTNLYYVRLCKSVVAARGGKLSGGWSVQRRRALGERLLQLPESLRMLPMRMIGYRTAELASSYRLSSLGAEAVAASERLSGPLCVWEGDDGPGIRAAAEATGVTYIVVAH